MGPTLKYRPETKEHNANNSNYNLKMIAALRCRNYSKEALLPCSAGKGEPIDRQEIGDNGSQ